MVGKEVSDGHKGMDYQHADNPPNFSLVTYFFVEGGIDNHPGLEYKEY